jgi:chromosome partitioning protein
MGKIITLANQKGGVGKTATAVNMSAALAMEGKKTLLVDFDPQCNASSGVGVGAAPAEESIYAAIIGESEVEKFIKPVEPNGLFLLPSSPHLAGAEIELVNMESREKRLKQALKPIMFLYDYLIVDCPPSLGLLTLNALAAADSVLVPLQCEYYALEGLSRLLETVEMVRASVNPALRLEGIVLTMFDARNNLSHQVSEDVVRHFGNRVFETVIPRNVRIGEAPSFGKPILLYDPHCRGAETYQALAKEIISRGKYGVPTADFSGKEK